MFIFCEAARIGNNVEGYPVMNETGRPRATPRSFCRTGRAMRLTSESIDTVARTGPGPVASTASPE